jgi:hypothetical protein
MIYFKGNKKQLRAFLNYLVLHWGKDTRVKDIPNVVCTGS